MALGSNRDSQILAALALARAGETDGAQRMADDVAKRSPLNTVLNGYWLPTIMAAVELNRKHPEKAIELLEAASGYELGAPPPAPNLWPHSIPCMYAARPTSRQAKAGKQLPSFRKSSTIGTSCKILCSAPWHICNWVEPRS